MSYESIILGEMNHGGLPFAYWPLDEANGTVAADLMVRAKGAGNNGVYVDTPTLDVRPGPINRGNGWATFNGSSEYVNVGTLGSLGSLAGAGITIEAWAATASTAARCLFGRYPGAFTNTFYVLMNQSDLAVATPGMIRFVFCDNASHRISGNTTYDTAWPNDGKPHHFVLALNPSGSAAIYVDGVSQAVTNRVAVAHDTFADYATDNYIGNRNGAPSYWAGQVGRVAIYNYLLAADRVKAHYLAGLNGVADKRLLLGV